MWQTIKDKAQKVINAADAAERRLFVKDLWNFIKGVSPLIGVPLLPTNYSFDHSESEAAGHIDGLDDTPLYNWGTSVHSWALQQEEN